MKRVNCCEDAVFCNFFLTISTYFSLFLDDKKHNNILGVFYRSTCDWHYVETSYTYDEFDQLYDVLDQLCDVWRW